MVIRKAEKSEYQTVRAFYHSLIDALEGTKYHPKWEKDLYPSQQDLRTALDEQTFYIGSEGDRIAAAMVVNQKCNDEYDDADKNYARINANNFLFEAKIPLGDFFRITDIPSEEFEKDAGEAETLGGFILELQGEIPAQETEIDYKNYRFKIVSADKRRIKSIKLTILNPDVKNE